MNKFLKIHNKIDTPNPDKEIIRFHIIKFISKKYKIDIQGVLLYEYIDNKNIEDPVLIDNIEDKNNIIINKKILKEINNIIKDKINIILKITKKTYNIKKINENNYIILKYNKYNIIIKKHLYDYIISKLIYKPAIDINIIIWCLTFRYKYLNLLTGISASMLPKYYKYLADKYNVNTEGFGGFFNHTLKYYYGLFYGLEKYFGCLGNFFNSELKDNFYVINPPFNVNIINLTIKHIMNNLKKFKTNIIIFLPTWDLSNRKILNKQCKKQLSLDYTDKVDEILLLRYKYTKKYYIYCKENIQYYDFITNQNHNYTPSSIIYLSNTGTNLDLSFLTNLDIKLKK